MGTVKSKIVGLQEIFSKEEMRDLSLRRYCVSLWAFVALWLGKNTGSSI